MEIEYASNRLAEAAVCLSEAGRLLGVTVGRKFIQRVAVLRATEKFYQLYEHRALRLHPLKGDREGQYSITLTGNFRLILEKVQEDKARIIGVEDYHGD